MPQEFHGNGSIHLIDRLYISIIAENLSHSFRNAVNIHMPKDRNTFVCASVDVSHHDFAPSSLAHMYSFHKSISMLLESIGDRDLVIAVAAEPSLITIVALLLGSHLIIGKGMTPQMVAKNFRLLESMFVKLTDGNNTDLSVLDCWKAIHRATTLGWVNFDSHQKHDVSEIIDMDEYLHYDDTHNGAMHLVDPSRLLLFREPADLPAGVAWEDEGGRRRFGAEHYAWLFEDFGVSLVVRCGGGERATSVEAGRGAGNEADRSTALCDGDAGARLLVAAHLIRSRGFCAAEALAWACMVHPVAAGAGPAVVLVSGAAGGS